MSPADRWFGDSNMQPRGREVSRSRRYSREVCTEVLAASVASAGRVVAERVPPIGPGSLHDLSVLGSGTG